MKINYNIIDSQGYAAGATLVIIDNKVMWKVGLFYDNNYPAFRLKRRFKDLIKYSIDGDFLEACDKETFGLIPFEEKHIEKADFDNNVSAEYVITEWAISFNRPPIISNQRLEEYPELFGIYMEDLQISFTYSAPIDSM